MPDFCQQVEANLDVLTHRSVNAQQRERVALSSDQTVQIVASATDGTRATVDLNITCASS